MAGDMIERVARAIAARRGVENDWPFWLHEAEAAIRAMRDFNTEDFTLTEASGIRRLFEDALSE